MSFMVWNNAFELGIKEFDEHHKHLVALLNMTYDGFTQGASRVEIAAVLDELVDYATYHFAAEEYWMGVNKYPYLTQHCEDHERFCKRVAEFQKEFHNGTSNLSLEVLQFINTWLNTHILKADADYGRFGVNLSHSEH